MIHLLLAALVGAASPNSGAAVPRVGGVVIVVGDLDLERRFYTQALDFKDLGESTTGRSRTDTLALGNERVELLSYGATGAAIPATARSSDRDFQHIAIIVSDMPRAWARVSRFDVRRVSVAPQTLPRWNPNAGGIAAVYFRDPEGHPLELLHFPAGKGASQWHAASPLFLGIDHTAIAVTNTTASTKFYEALGLTVRGHSNNYGIEQQRLSGVAGAHVMITAVRFDSAPGVEFLEYLNSVPKQPEESVRLSDLVATRTLIVETNASALCKTMRAVLRASRSCIVRDPDGHLVEIDSSTP
jgi:catechol 2,3-dioxygenase-like lactoylglutathione lyase family enzyme